MSSLISSLDSSGLKTRAFLSSSTWLTTRIYEYCLIAVTISVCWPLFKLLINVRNSCSLVPVSKFCAVVSTILRMSSGIVF